MIFRLQCGYYVCSECSQLKWNPFILCNSKHQLALWSVLLLNWMRWRELVEHLIEKVALKIKWVVRFQKKSFCDRKRDILCEIMWPDSSVRGSVTNHIQLSTHTNLLTHSFNLSRLSNSVFRPTYTYSLMRASLLIYSHEFRLHTQFSAIWFHSDFVYVCSVYFGCNITLALEQNGRLHMCVFRCMWTWAKGEKINKTRKRTRKKNNAKPKRFIWYEL